MARLVGVNLPDNKRIEYALTKLLKDALKQAREYGLAWRDEQIVANADDRLTQLIERSRHATDVDGDA